MDFELLDFLRKKKLSFYDLEKLGILMGTETFVEEFIHEYFEFCCSFGKEIKDYIDSHYDFLFSIAKERGYLQYDKVYIPGLYSLEFKEWSLKNDKK